MRDSYASHLGHHSRMVFIIFMKVYFSAAENEPMCRLKHRFLTKMVQPCGPPP